MTCTMACMSRAGREPGFKKQNQDNCFAFEKYITGDQALFGAFDGHGPNGESRRPEALCDRSLLGPHQQLRCSSLKIKIKDQRRSSAACELAALPGAHDPFWQSLTSRNHPAGHLVSGYVKQHLPIMLVNHLSSEADAQKALTRGESCLRPLL